MKKRILFLFIILNVILFSNTEILKKKFVSDGKLHIQELMEKSWKYGNEDMPNLNLKIIQEDKNYYGIITADSGPFNKKQKLNIFKKVLLQDEVGYCYGYDTELKKLVVVDPDDLRIIFISHD